MVCLWNGILLSLPGDIHQLASVMGSSKAGGAGFAGTLSGPNQLPRFQARSYEEPES